MTCLRTPRPCTEVSVFTDAKCPRYERFKIWLGRQGVRGRIDRQQALINSSTYHQRHSSWTTWWNFIYFLYCHSFCWQQCCCYEIMIWCHFLHELSVCIPVSFKKFESFLFNVITELIYYFSSLQLCSPFVRKCTCIFNMFFIACSTLVKGIKALSKWSVLQYCFQAQNQFQGIPIKPLIV